MKDIFKISKTLCHNVQTGKIAAEDLVLCQTKTRHSRTWELKKASKATKDDPSVVAKGKDLTDLFKSVANGLKTDKFDKLASLQSFRVFSKAIPGIETPEHRASVQGKIRKVASRIRDPLRTLGEGIHKLKLLNMPWKMVDTDYLLHELTQKFSGMPSNITHKLADIWKESNTSQNFQDWLKAKNQSWKDSGSSKDFAAWVVEGHFNAKEKEAWQQEHPRETFTEEKFADWKITQYPPDRVLPEPLWLLREEWKKFCAERKKEGNPPVSFKKWVDNTIEDRKKFYADAKEWSEGILATDVEDDVSFRIIDGYMFEGSTTASPLDPDVYIAKREWESTRPTDTSDEAFREFLDRRKYDYFLEQNPLPFPPSFEEWKEGKEEEVRKAWEASKTALPFDAWKSQQRREPLHPVPFVRLDAEERKAYLNECSEGKLYRKGELFSSEYEKTAHSGRGWVIFVIGPDDDLYCGSHIPGAFHHSSFLGDRAVMAAGEIKISSDGTILSISSKSGHYKPSTKGNIAMLRWFEARGIDLSTVEFSYFQADGKESPKITAQAYLDSLA